ncbi:MAG: hypothetical protein V1800_03225 [Candidatus Latescibacterota bacterium]
MRERRLFRYVFACLLVLMGAGSGWGETKYAGEFLALGAGARALGMGSAFVAVSDDATAAYWNAAGLSRLGEREGSLTHSEQFAGVVKYDFAGFGMPLGEHGGLAVGMIRVGVDDIQFTALDDPKEVLSASNRPRVSSVESNVDYAVYLSQGRRVWREWSVGGSLKVIRRTIGEHSAWGYGLDVGALLAPARGLTFGANLRDVTGTMVSWDTGAKDRIRPSLSIGMAYRVHLPTLKGQVLWSLGSGRLGADGREEGVGGVNAGMEYQYGNLLSVRLGSQEEHLTAGAGIRYLRFGVDYAFSGHEALGGTHRVSASVRL